MCGVSMVQLGVSEGIAGSEMEMTKVGNHLKVLLMFVSETDLEG